MTDPGISLTVLSDNQAGEHPLAVEHGFSAFIECGATRILFDTGSSTLFADNAHAMGIRWFEADAVVLSHGHYDHTGGVAHAVSGNSRAKWYLHPDALVPRYRKQEPDPPRSIGMPTECRVALEGITDRLIRTTKPVRISNSIGVTGPIPRHIQGEDVGGPFFLDTDCTVADPLVDDQALWIRAGNGLFVVFGCAHAGVGNTLDYIANLYGERIIGVIGGFHLQGTGATRLQAAVDAIRRHGVKWIWPAHCTGEAAVTILKRNFPDAVKVCQVGDVHEW